MENQNSPIVIFEGVNSVLGNGLANLAEDGKRVFVFDTDADAVVKAVEKIITENQDKVTFVEINDAEVEAGEQMDAVLISFGSGFVKLVNDKIANKDKYIQ